MIDERWTLGVAMCLVLVLSSNVVAASADFNGDGFDDLAVGAPSEDIGGFVGAGAVHVLYGSPNGVRANGDQLLHLGLPGVEGELATNTAFGEVLSIGDFDGDGFDDLAVGALRDH